MKKIKNQNELLRVAISVGEKYALNRGYTGFSSTNSSKEKVESLYRLLVNDNMIQPLAEDSEDLASMKVKLVKWISKQLPENHPLLN